MPGTTPPPLTPGANTATDTAPVFYLWHNNNKIWQGKANPALWFADNSQYTLVGAIYGVADVNAVNFLIPNARSLHAPAPGESPRWWLRLFDPAAPNPNLRMMGQYTRQTDYGDVITLGTAGQAYMISFGELKPIRR